jgi:arylsulfatase A-like enzyme
MMNQPTLRLLAFYLLLFASSAFATEKPNIILIIADDQGMEDCGAYGNAGVRTPNVDRLAAEGLRCEAAILTCSSCSPSRSSIITGRYPHNTGAEQLHWPLPGDQVTFPEKLRAAGYWTAAAGKWHLGEAVLDRFDVVHEAGANAFQLPGKGGKMVASKNPSGCEEWVPTMRERPRDKPFFLWLAAFDPHRDYERNIIPQPHKPADVTVPPYLPDTPKVREDLGLYYDEISRLDSFVGKVIDELKAQGVENNTLVIYTSDNGRPFPRCKTTVYDSGIRTPLIMRWPGHIKPGSVSPRLVSTVDIAPTILALAGIQPGPTFQGVSFAPLFSDPNARIRDYAFAEHNWHDYEARSRAVRSERYKYIRNEYTDLANTPPADAVRSLTYVDMIRLHDAGKLTPEQTAPFESPLRSEELYDLQADPHELKNLAPDPAHAETLRKLRAELDRWKKQTQDVTPPQRTPDEFDRRTGEPNEHRKRPRIVPKWATAKGERQP